MEQAAENTGPEHKGGHINLALELDENVPGYDAFSDIPLKTPAAEGKDVVDFPTSKSPYSETDESTIRITNDVIFEDLPVEKEANGLGKIMEKIQTVWEVIESFVTKNKRQIKIGLYILLMLLYTTYFIGAIYHYHQDNTTKEICDQGSSLSECFWCHGLGFLIIITVIVFIYLLYAMLFKRVFNWFFTSTVFGEKSIQRVFRPTALVWEDFMKMRYAALIINCVVITAFLIFLIVDTSDDRRRLLSILGLVVIIVFGAVFSRHPGRIRWRHVIWGLALQFIFGLFILRWSVGQNIFDCLGKKVQFGGPILKSSNCYILI